ncbi:MAG: hypothetical protein ACYTG5_18430 [Planctomycetota bacterium]
MRSLIALATLAFAVSLPAQELLHRQQPEELGLVNWERSFEKALGSLRKTDKPMLLLFQEVPG